MLIWYLDLELTGAGLTVIIQSTTNFVIVYYIVHKMGVGKEAITDISREAFEGWWDCFKMGVPTYFMQLFAFISTEIVTLITAMIDSEILVANTSLVNLLYMFYLYIYAVSQSCSVMIGNKIGEGSKSGAQKLINANILFGFIFTFVEIAIFYVTKEHLFLVYATNESILNKMGIISNAFLVALASYLLKDTFC